MIQLPSDSPYKIITQDGNTVPVIFGVCRINGTIILLGAISPIGYLPNHFTHTPLSGFQMQVWFGIGAGKLQLLTVFVDEKIYTGAVSAFPVKFNAGTPDGSDTYFPVITNGLTFGNNNAYPYNSKLRGIAHAYFGQLISENNNTIPKVDFLVQKVYPTQTHPIDVAQGADINSMTIINTLPTWVVVMAYQGVYTSPDLQSWTQQNEGVSDPQSVAIVMHAVTYGFGLFIAVGEYGKFISSPDSVVWTDLTPTLTPVPTLEKCKVRFLNGLFVAIGAPEPWVGTGTPPYDAARYYYVYISGDGVTWSAQHPTGYIQEHDPAYYAPQMGNDVAFGAGRWVAIFNQLRLTLYSTDGITWNIGNYEYNPPYPITFTDELTGICYGNGEFYCCGRKSDVDEGTIVHCPDGSSWSYRTVVPAPRPLNAICYGFPGFVAVGDKGCIIYSATGANFTWATVVSGVSNDITGVSYQNGLYYATCKDASLILVSSDGMSWYANTSQHPGIMDMVFQSNQTLSGGTNPAHVIYDILTGQHFGALGASVSPQFGLGIPDSKLDITSFKNVAYSMWSGSRQYGLSAAMTADSARTVLDAITAHTDLFIYEQADKIYLAQLYDAAATSQGTLMDDDFQSFTLTRQQWKEVPNDFEGTYLEPDADYQSRSLEVRNEAAVIMSGGMINKVSVDLTMFNSAQIACQRLTELMQRDSFPKATIECDVDRKFSYLNPGDLLTIQSTEYSVNGVFRIVSKSFNKINTQAIKLSLIQAFEGLNNGAFTPVKPSSNSNSVPNIPSVIQKQIDADETGQIYQEQIAISITGQSSIQEQV